MRVTLFSGVVATKQETGQRTGCRKRGDISGKRGLTSVKCGKWEIRKPWKGLPLQHSGRHRLNGVQEAITTPQVLSSIPGNNQAVGGHLSPPPTVLRCG